MPKLGKKMAEKKLQETRSIIFKKLDVKNKSADFFLVSNKEMESIRGDLALRPDFKGKEAEKIRHEEFVSVLAFPESKEFKGIETPKTLGEIYINYDFAEGDADRLTTLFIHGLLHLLGYDHMSKHDTMDMEKLEKELFVFVNSK